MLSLSLLFENCFSEKITAKDIVLLSTDEQAIIRKKMHNCVYFPARDFTRSLHILTVKYRFCSPVTRRYDLPDITPLDFSVRVVKDKGF